MANVKVLYPAYIFHHKHRCLLHARLLASSCVQKLAELLETLQDFTVAVRHWIYAWWVPWGATAPLGAFSFFLVDRRKTQL